MEWERCNKWDKNGFTQRSGLERWEKEGLSRFPMHSQDFPVVGEMEQLDFVDFGGENHPWAGWSQLCPAEQKPTEFRGCSGCRTEQEDVPKHIQGYDFPQRIKSTYPQFHPL